MSYKTIYRFKNLINEALVLGPNNKNIDLIESFYKEEILVRSAEVKISEDSDKENILVMLFEVLETIFENDVALTEVDIFGILNNLTVDNGDALIKLFLKKEILITTFTAKPSSPDLKPKTLLGSARQQRHHLRDRTGRHRQDISRRPVRRESA